MNVAVLAPWRPGSPERERLWDFTRQWWSEHFPHWPIYTAPGPDGPFNRSAAINAAAAGAGEWDVAVIVDTDAIPEQRNAAAAAYAAAATGQMVVGHTRRHMLKRQSTQKILDGRGVGSWSSSQNVERVWHDSVSCLVAVNRSLWDACEGFDPLFVGWGREDTAFRIACEAMSGHPIICLDGESWHLWHPVTPEAAKSHPLRRANEERHQRYVAARWDREAVAELIAERHGTPTAAADGSARIPKIIHRTVPADTSAEVEAWWSKFAELHPGWSMRTHREPLDPADWPLTSAVWSRCANGAQKAGLIRLEALVTFGGVYVDSDVEPFRPFDPLLHLPAFAAWEDETTVPDAVLGAAPGHPVFRQMLDEAVRLVKARKDAWTTGPGVATKHLPGRDDVLLLPPGAFYPHHYLEKNQAGKRIGPWVFCEHRWHHSWGSEASKADIAARQR